MFLISSYFAFSGLQRHSLKSDTIIRTALYVSCATAGEGNIANIAHKAHCTGIDAKAIIAYIIISNGHSKSSSTKRTELWNARSLNVFVNSVLTAANGSVSTVAMSV